MDEKMEGQRAGVAKHSAKLLKQSWDAKPGLCGTAELFPPPQDFPPESKPHLGLS
jgi:hypothetical protein